LQLNILALETSTEACSAALMNAQGQVFSEFEITPRQHTRFLPKMLDSVLKQSEIKRADVNCIAFANGPGAFTGVRIAAATAQGLAIGLSVPLMAISTLAVLAQQGCDTLSCNQVQAALDARMGEAYRGLFKKNSDTGLVELVGEERLLKLDQLHPDKDKVSVGSGFQAWLDDGFSKIESGPIHANIFPTASALVKLARQAIDSQQMTTADKAEINYIRNKVAEKKKVV